MRAVVLTLTLTAGVVVVGMMVWTAVGMARSANRRQRRPDVPGRRSRRSPRPPED
jgi:hypothetical protein